MAAPHIHASLQHPCSIAAASLQHRGCIPAASRLHPCCIAAASLLHRGCSAFPQWRHGSVCHFRNEVWTARVLLRFNKTTQFRKTLQGGVHKEETADAASPCGFGGIAVTDRWASRPGRRRCDVTKPLHNPVTPVKVRRSEVCDGAPGGSETTCRSDGAEDAWLLSWSQLHRVSTSLELETQWVGFRK
ncbi:hypothetical protein EYF80_065671 [Liparis tanakae]|uniref:Uncharacterized protein n=1 Tax=Liparis tanakae TaxID=230148 RepID=A0A4Z2E5L1_9TELE|nr:hypothetical protein EYF80_065671 [Liparis tanakae]